MRNLSAEEKNLLYRLTVRTANLKKDENDPNKDVEFNFGSGTIIASSENCYVMTAGHCVDGMDKDHIKVEWCNGKDFVRLEVLEVVCCKFDENTGDDYALLRIDSPDSDIDYTQIIKRFDLAIEEDNYFMLAYPPNARKGRLFEVKANIDDFWNVAADVNYAQDDFKTLINGCSGAGILVYRHNRFYYVGMAVATRDQIGRFNDILVKNPGVFDGCLPDDTRDVDYFNTLRIWEDWTDNLNAEERRTIIRKLNIDWLDYLTRKAQVLFPRDYNRMVDMYIKYYVKGMRIITDMLQSNASFVSELNKVNDKFFNNMLETHKEDFDSSDGAYTDLKKIIDDVKASIAARFPEDKDGKIARDYALFRVAERLLNCQLDYRAQA